MYDVFLNCKGKYIAFLEGDDFWTDPSKLKMQINFLESNNSYIACTHRYAVVDEDNNIIQAEYFGPGRPEEGAYKVKDFENYIYYGHSGTLVFKNIFLHPKYDYSIIWKAHNFVGDITLCMILVCLGDIYVMKNNMASYRSVQKKGGTNYVSSISKKMGCFKGLTIYKHLRNIVKPK